MMNEIFEGFKTGCVQAFRGYFAPLRLSPWRAAIAAGKQPGARWFSPVAAWIDEINCIVADDAKK